MFDHDGMSGAGSMLNTMSNRICVGERCVEVVPFYVVQKCWYSGPKITPTVDYLRLLPSIFEAEQVAYQSAHTYASSGKSSSPVRTIQVPLPFQTHHSHHNQPQQQQPQNPQQQADVIEKSTHPKTMIASSSTYGFVADGTLFWVRRIQAFMTLDPQGSTAVDSAHCILTQGVIGGTGNRSSRRGSEDTSTPVAFVGPSGYAWALRQITTPGLVPIGSTCQWVPVGKPDCKNITAEWPDRASWHSRGSTTGMSALQQTGFCSNTNAAKRISDASRANHWFTSSTSSSSFQSASESDEDELDESYFQHQQQHLRQQQQQNRISSSTMLTSMEMESSQNHHRLLFTMPPAAKRRRHPGYSIMSTSTSFLINENNTIAESTVDGVHYNSTSTTMDISMSH